MDQFEYLLMFVAVILGLAVTDLAISLHRLLSAGAKVKWDWLSPMAAVVALLKVSTQWWTWYGAESIAKQLTFSMFLGVVIVALLLYLLAAAALPDEANEHSIDLSKYYSATARGFWLLFALHWMVNTAVSEWAEHQIAGSAFAIPVFAILVPIAISLAFIRNRWWHTLCLSGFCGLYIIQIFNTRLS